MLLSPPWVFSRGVHAGAIPALGCCLALAAAAPRETQSSGEETTISTGVVVGECVLLNAATAFWPAWLNQLLPAQWWTPSDADESRLMDLVGAAVHSWVVRDDPLSEGTPGGARAPRAPGTTIVLPARATGLALIENHAFSHFWPRPGPGSGGVATSLRPMKM